MSNEQQSTAQAFSFEAFNIQSTTWDRWVKRFENALEVFGVDPEKKRRMLLHYMGAETYNTLCDKAMPIKPEDMQYENVVELLEEHFNPKPNEILENYRFHLRKQRINETTSEFAIALRKLSTNCNFGNYIDTAIRNQFVFGLRNQHLQSRLLEKQNLTLSIAIQTASAYETAEKSGMELHQQTSLKDETVNKVYKRNSAHQQSKKEVGEKKEMKSTDNRNNQCFRCGDRSHLANECKYKNATCHFCKKKGHLRKVCFKEKRVVHKIDEEATSVEFADVAASLLHIEDSEQNKRQRKKIMHNMNVGGRAISFEVDTGSPVSIISVEDAKKHFPNHQMMSSDLKLYSYCQTAIDCLGYIWVKIKGETNTKRAKLYIVRSERKPLLGREWLYIVKIDWRKIFGVNTTKSEVVDQIQVGAVPIKMLQEQFPRVFSNSTGKITGFQAKLYLKPDATPKCMRARRVPFSLQTAVERELENQVREGLLIKVDKSEWATPVVVVPKGDGSVRLCGDYKVTLNPVLLVDEHPLPTIDELFSSMAGGAKFTKIDLSKAYLQLEVDAADQHLLTLSTHKGLYQPTRLMFGIACAPAKWQRFMEQLLNDIPGVTVFLDDIKITAPDDETHIQRLIEGWTSTI